jgi:hypothetical protein
MYGMDKITAGIINPCRHTLLYLTEIPTIMVSSEVLFQTE